MSLLYRPIGVDSKSPAKAGLLSLFYEARKAGLLAASGVLLDNPTLSCFVDSGEYFRKHFDRFVFLSSFNCLFELLDGVFHCTSAAIVNKLLASAYTDGLFC